MNALWSPMNFGVNWTRCTENRNQISNSVQIGQGKCISNKVKWIFFPQFFHSCSVLSLPLSPLEDHMAHNLITSSSIFGRSLWMFATTIVFILINMHNHNPNPTIAIHNNIMDDHPLNENFLPFLSYTHLWSKTFVILIYVPKTAKELQFKGTNNIWFSVQKKLLWTVKLPSASSMWFMKCDDQNRFVYCSAKLFSSSAF